MTKLSGTATHTHGNRSQTLAYMLPVLSLAIRRAEAEHATLTQRRRNTEAGTLQAIVIAPSRELAMQIVRVGHSLLPVEARGCLQQAIGGANPVRQASSATSSSCRKFGMEYTRSHAFHTEIRKC